MRWACDPTPPFSVLGAASLQLDARSARPALQLSRNSADRGIRGEMSFLAITSLCCVPQPFNKQ